MLKFRIGATGVEACIPAPVASARELHLRRTWISCARACAADGKELLLTTARNGPRDSASCAYHASGAGPLVPNVGHHCGLYD